MRVRPIRLPQHWRKSLRSSVLHAISLAAAALTTAWARAGTCRASPQRAAAGADRLRTELALVREELDIKDERWRRAPARRRPHYGPVQRMRILELRALRGWTVEETARRFLVTEMTLQNWMRRLDEGTLIRTAEPVNRFPDFVAYLVRRLKTVCPALGKVRIAQQLARAGLHIGPTTVGRMLRAPGPKEADEVAEEVARVGVVAKEPNDVWHVDLTVVPTGAGFWVPWAPFAKILRWPFAWWVSVAIDQASRRIVGFAVFKRRPNSGEVCAFMDRAAKRLGARPRHVVTDKGREFHCRPFRAWCRGHGIRSRTGAVGEHGSIAIVERFIRSMKAECTRRILVPLRLADMRAELAVYGTWYNEHRPHTALAGRTPMEVYDARDPANRAPRVEPRRRWPPGSRCARPFAPTAGRAGQRVRLKLSYLDGRRHLPVVEITTAA